MSECHAKKWKTGLSKDISSAPFSTLVRTGQCAKSILHRRYHTNFWYWLWIQSLSERGDYNWQPLFSCLCFSHNVSTSSITLMGQCYPAFVHHPLHMSIRLNQILALTACFRTTAGINMSRLALIYSWLSDLCACYYFICFLLER